MFITFEGIEGSGKSTQLQRCADHFSAMGYDLVVTKEPGGTQLGKMVREWLLNPGTTFQHAYTEVLLFIADRCEHVETVIKPALKKGQVVLCDRYIDSTLAYQFAGRQLDEGFIHSLNNLVDLSADLTLLFDCDVSVGLSRAKARAKLDRFEHEELAFHERIKAQYCKLAREQSNRIKVIDANAELDDVFQQVVAVISPQLKRINV